MKAIKLMITGALLILLGPVMTLVDDFTFWDFCILCWIIGVPLFVVGLIMPEGGFKTPKQSEDLPQKECPNCGEMHDFDYPKCPHCGHDYQAKQIK